MLPTVCFEKKTVSELIYMLQFIVHTLQFKLFLMNLKEIMHAKYAFLSESVTEINWKDFLRKKRGKKGI